MNELEPRDMHENAAPPGEVFNICGIPTAVTEEHHQSFYYWQRFGIRGANGLRIDGHPDMGDGADIHGQLPQDYWRSLSIENFTCPGFYYGILRSMYWFNPHATAGALRDLGSITMPDRPKLVIRTRQWGNDERDLEMRWDGDIDDINSMNHGVSIDRSQMHIDRPFLLDVDLDGFSCLNQRSLGVTGQEVHWNEDHEGGYEERIVTTVELLATLPKPDWITITRSQATPGFCPTRTFVPPQVVDDVQARFVRLLEELFQAV